MVRTRNGLHTYSTSSAVARLSVGDKMLRRCRLVVQARQAERCMHLACTHGVIYAWQKSKPGGEVAKPTKIWRPVCEARGDGEPATERRQRDAGDGACAAWRGKPDGAAGGAATGTDGRRLSSDERCSYGVSIHFQSVERIHWRRRRCLRVKGIGNGPLLLHFSLVPADMDRCCSKLLSVMNL